MSRKLLNIFATIFLLNCVLIDQVICKRSKLSFGSRGPSHSYPSSGGLSGHSPSHSYPSSNTGLSGNSKPYGGNSHGYPPSTGLSGSHSYPSSHGLSGNAPKPSYHYTQPQQISYTPHYGAAPQHFPAYHGQPPVYVQQVRNSNSRFGELLTGLALMNLAVSGASLYHSLNSNDHKSSSLNSNSFCTFKIEDGPNYEITKIPCEYISVLIQNSTSEVRLNDTTLETKETVSATPNVTGEITNHTLDNHISETMSNESVTVLVNGTVPVDALKVEGAKVEVKPSMKCSVQMKTPDKQLNREIDCALLQAYNAQSFKQTNTGQILQYSTLSMCGLLTASIFLH